MKIAEFCALRADPKVKERHSTCPVCGLSSSCSFDEFASIWCRNCRCHWREIVLWRVNLMTGEERGLAERGGFLFVRKVPNGGVLSVALLNDQVCQLLYQPFQGREDSWLYQRVPAAIAAASHWNPAFGLGNTEPHGWFRHMSSGRRRLFGDASRESKQEIENA